MNFQIQAQKQKRKIGVCFFIAFILMAGLGLYNYAVLQGSNNKVIQITEKEMPLLIIEKGLAAAVDASQGAVQGYLADSGDVYEEQWQKQKAILLYQIGKLEKTNVSGELTGLLEKNKEWFTFVEKEVMSTGSDAEAFAINLESSKMQLQEIQAGYAEQIAIQEAVIQKMEYEVMTTEKTTAVLLGMMSLILSAASISGAALLLKKYLFPKGIIFLSKTA